jgi:hypothetical protein
VEEQLVGRSRDDPPRSMRRARYDFLHEGILRSYLSKLGQDAKDAAVYWKYGCWFSEKKTSRVTLIESNWDDPESEIGSGAVVIEAADGHRAVFSLAELCPDFVDRVTLLVDTKDKQPLPPGEGPFRIIVPGDKLRGRWVCQVKAVAVHCPGRSPRLLLLVDQE